MASRPPGWILFGLAAVFCVAVTWGRSGLSLGFLDALALVALLLVVSGIWIVRAVCYVVFRVLGRAPAPTAWVKLLAVPVILAPTVIAADSDLPERIRFAQARGAFEQTVREIYQGAEQAVRLGPLRLGTLTIEYVRRYGANVYFSVAGAEDGFILESGFAYLPNGEPVTPDLHGDSVPVWRFSGYWYRYNVQW